MAYLLHELLQSRHVEWGLDRAGRCGGRGGGGYDIQETRLFLATPRPSLRLRLLLLALLIFVRALHLSSAIDREGRRRVPEGKGKGTPSF